ncbi:Carboxylesterase type B [Neofusicoccum parvum]|uniref:Putative type 2a phosphatase activator tip41 protein n=1 Tax=Botryosphaeria parva (strain UCR-NP2) TaxID=1287680 RepID=R1GN03_BOTPV|nr:putative type 2a phosphatase activator tip41 protein [Neofusicoccum parvum UCRNP2]GME59048.1 Carboxylesterase type B [Neofusicoccum parvum]
MDAAFPTPADQGKTLNHEGWKITTRKLPILKAGPIDDMTAKLGIAPPEMIFGDNAVRLEHAATGWHIEFNAFGALDRVDKTGEKRLEVAYSREWQQTRQNHASEIKEVVKPYDWSFSTDYAGSVPEDVAPKFEETETMIPLALLKRPDPILFFDEVMLYEDELADNGISLVSCKIRVMPARLLLLCRFFLRLDDVLFRIRDTRVFVEFATGEVIREYTAREEKYEVVKKKMAITREDVPALMRDPNRLVEFVPIIDGKLEKCIVK